MPDLILLCAGAATDRDAQAGHDPLGSAGTAETLRGGGFGRAFRRASVASDASDDSALPRETPDEAWLRDLFGVPEADSIEAWGVAAAGAALPVWQAVPCNVQVGHYQLVLTDPGELRLTLDEAREFADAIVDLLRDAGFGIMVSDPLHWMLSGNDDWALETHAWTMAVGRSIDGHLPRGPRERDWRRLFTEAQIAWHDHPANRRREALGMRTVNALWLDGRACGPLARAPAAVVSTSPPLLGLARTSGARVVDAGWRGLTRETLAGIAGALNARRAGSRHGSNPSAAGDGDLVVDVDAWRDARRRSDREGWLAGWTAFSRWLDDTGLSSGTLPAGLDRLRAVMTGERRCIELLRPRAAGLRFWRTLDPIDAVLGR